MPANASASPSRASGPLAGIGVIITRPVRQAAALAVKLASLGADPIVWPAIVILPPDDPAPLARAHARLADYDIAIFVSANAVEYGAPGRTGWKDTLQVYAPGASTAEALAAVGCGQVTIPTSTYDSEGLLALPALQQVRGKRVVIFRGEQGREHLGDALRARGASVDYIACYRRAAPRGDAAGLLDTIRSGRARALSLTSVEGVDNLIAAVGPARVALLAQLKTFAPHPRIVEAARTHGLDAIVTGPGDGGLVAALLEWVSAAR